MGVHVQPSNGSQSASGTLLKVGTVLLIAAAMVVVRMTLSLAPPVEYAADPPASVERFLLVRVQAVIKRLKLGLDCLQAGKSGIRHLFGERHSAGRRRKIWLVCA